MAGDSAEPLKTVHDIDQAGRDNQIGVLSMGSTTPLTTTYAFNDNEQMTGVALPNNVEQDAGYDGANRLVSLSAQNTSNHTLLNNLYQYGYDPLGLTSAITTTVQGVNRREKSDLRRFWCVWFFAISGHKVDACQTRRRHGPAAVNRRFSIAPIVRLSVLWYAQRNRLHRKRRGAHVSPTMESTTTNPRYASICAPLDAMERIRLRAARPWRAAASIIAKPTASSRPVHNAITDEPEPDRAAPW